MYITYRVHVSQVQYIQYVLTTIVTQQYPQLITAHPSQPQHYYQHACTIAFGTHLNPLVCRNQKLPIMSSVLKFMPRSNIHEGITSVLHMYVLLRGVLSPPPLSFNSITKCSGVRGGGGRGLSAAERVQSQQLRFKGIYIYLYSNFLTYSTFRNIVFVFNSAAYCKSYRNSILLYTTITHQTHCGRV